MIKEFKEKQKVFYVKPPTDKTLGSVTIGKIDEIEGGIVAIIPSDSKDFVYFNAKTGWVIDKYSSDFIAPIDELVAASFD